MKISKNKILLFIIISVSLCCNIISQDYWLRVPSPTGRILTRCIFVDTVFGWAAGDSGTIISTTNSGQSWSVQNSGVTDYGIDDIFFLNRRLGWALSNDFFFQGTFVHKTTNGGLNWSVSYFPDTSVIITAIFFNDSLNGIAAGSSGNIFRTTNGGLIWNESSIDTAGCFLYGFPKNRINFINSSTGYICGGRMDLQGIIWKTTNSGLYWSVYCVTPEPLFDIQILNSNKVIACGGDFEFGAITSTTYNTGSNWDYVNIGIGGVGHDLAFRTPAEVWMPLAFSQSWAVSLDSGSSSKPWIHIPAPDSTAVYAARFKSPTFGFAFGTFGSILKYNSAIIGITPGSNYLPSSYSLDQNYPNPFNPATNITYTLAKPEFVKITIYDIQGKQVKVFIEGNRPQGINRFRFESYAMASGVYFYRLDAGNYTESKKMVIIK